METDRKILPTNQEQVEDTYLVSRTIENIGSMFRTVGGGSSTGYASPVEFHMCLDPGDEILEFGVCFAEASQVPTFLATGNNLDDLLDGVAARDPIGANEVAPVPVEGQSTVTTTKSDRYVLVDATSADVTVNIYNSGTYGAREITVKKTDATANTVTLVPDYGNTIDGSLSYVLSLQNESVTLVPTPTNWWIV